MATPAAPPAPSQRLDHAETQAQDRIDELLAGLAVGAVTGAALLALAGALTAAILAPAQAALAVGAQIAVAGAPRSARRTGGRRPAPQPLPSPIDEDVLALVMDAAARLDAAQDRAEELERTRRRLHRLAVTKIHQAASSGTAMYADQLGLSLQWVTRQDGRACPVCAAMHGRTVAPGRRFAPPRGPGIPTRLWQGFQGLPPAHPNCRCRPRPVRA